MCDFRLLSTGWLFSVLKSSHPEYVCQFLREYRSKMRQTCTLRTDTDEWISRSCAQDLSSYKRHINHTYTQTHTTGQTMFGLLRWSNFQSITELQTCIFILSPTYFYIDFLRTWIWFLFKFMWKHVIWNNKCKKMHQNSIQDRVSRIWITIIFLTLDNGI